MSYIADLGGTRGHGLVNPKEHDTVFTDDWGLKVCTINMAIWFGGAWSADETRHSMERMDPAHYLSSSYWEHWLHFMEELLVKKGVVTQQELDCGKLLTSGVGSTLISKVPPERCWPAFREGGSTHMPLDTQQRFAVGDTIRCININPAGHSRLPRYARGRVGTVVAYRGSFDAPETRAEGIMGHPQHCYGVRIEGTELWGVDGGRKDAVYLDLWESYMEPAQ